MEAKDLSEIVSSVNATLSRKEMSPADTAKHEALGSDFKCKDLVWALFPSRCLCLCLYMFLLSNGDLLDTLFDIVLSKTILFKISI